MNIVETWAIHNKISVITDIPLLGTANRIAKKMIILIRESKLQSSKEAAKTQMSDESDQKEPLCTSFLACNCYATMLNKGKNQKNSMA